MFVYLSRLFVASCVCFLLFVPLNALAAADDVVAQVGSISITKYELGREFQRILPLSGSYHGGVSKEKVQEIRGKALDRCIERALKAMYALENEIAPDMAAVNKDFKTVRNKFESDDSFLSALGGESIEAFRGSLFRKYLATAAENAAVDSKVTVSDEEMKVFYNKNKDKFINPRQYKASHILVKVDPAATKEQRNERLEFAESLLLKARSGEDFYNLAYYNSDDRTKFVGGDLGYFSQGKTVKEFDDVVTNMKVGEISDVVQTLYGYHIIKLTDVKPQSQMSFAEVQKTLLPEMKKAHRDKLLEEWVEKLRNKYPIKKIES